MLSNNNELISLIKIKEEELEEIQKKFKNEKWLNLAIITKQKKNLKKYLRIIVKDDIERHILEVSEDYDERQLFNNIASFLNFEKILKFYKKDFVFKKIRFKNKIYYAIFYRTLDYFK